MSDVHVEDLLLRRGAGLADGSGTRPTAPTSSVPTDIHREKVGGAATRGSLGQCVDSP